MGSCSAFHSKLMQFRSTEKYCDMKIRVQDRSFSCHRAVLAAASEYFDALFGGSFMEKDARETVLHDINVETFKEILKCVYTAEMCEITASNVLNLLSASLFLIIHPLEEACTKYILENVSLIQNHIRILALARTLNMTTALINVVTDYVIQNFRLFYNDETLLEMTFDDLSFLLGRWSKNELPFNYEDLLLNFLICWVHHASEERREYFIKLIATLDIERISPNYVKFMMQYYADFIGQPGLDGMPPLNLPPVMEESEATSDLPVRNWHDDTEDSKMRLCLKRKLSEHFPGKEMLTAFCGEEIPASFHDPTFCKDVLGLHIYVEYTVTESHPEMVDCSESVKILSTNKYYPDWFVSETDAWRSCAERRTVLQESTNLLYCIEIYQDGRNFADRRQTFCTYSSVDLKLASSVLTSPPVHLRQNDFNMCATSRNNIYLFNFLVEKYKNHERFANNLFSIEEINRGFYRYNCEVDQWFPAPKMKSHQDFPSICFDHNLIYSIGGWHIEYGCYAPTFQAFDHRSGKWMALPTCITLDHDHFDSNSCVLQDKVFISSNFSHIQSYDTVACKWESIRRPEEYCREEIKMVSYDNRLWFAYSSHDSENCYSLATYNPKTQGWYQCEEFDNVIRRGKPNRADGNFYACKWNIKDMILFKTCS